MSTNRMVIEHTDTGMHTHTETCSKQLCARLCQLYMTHTARTSLRTQTMCALTNKADHIDTIRGELCSGTNSTCLPLLVMLVIMLSISRKCLLSFHTR